MIPTLDLANNFILQTKRERNKNNIQLNPMKLQKLLFLLKFYLSESHNF